ncbi:MAG: ABC-F family ATP-binding cassette domain-containing protein [Candidatus Parcubacteria bacterium]|nr:ABC-F family ATP-binding cassette domain-containing protein [Candidatus Paceibacterota bacterium]
MADKLLLQILNLKKTYGPKVIFDEANVSITEKVKIGVIGRNGAGKSTLFKMIMDLEQPDWGEVIKTSDLRLGYIPQVDPYDPSETIMGFLTRYTGREEWECAKVASQFQLKGDMLTNPISNLSGGFQMRVKLTSTLLFEPNLLLLDEPTNYLDLSTLILLENFLQTFKGGFLCITHDREFIKKTCTATMEVEDGQIVLHPEPLEEYLEFKAEQKALATSVNKNIEKKQKQLQTFVDRFGAKASMAKSAQSKAKAIIRMDSKKIAINNPLATVRMWIPPVVARGGTALDLVKLDIGYPGKSIATNISITTEKGRKVAILGDNGQGKSTLLKTIAGKLDVLGGTMKWANSAKIGFYAQHVNLALNPEDTVEQYLKSKKADGLSDDTVLRVMSCFLFKKNDAFKEISVLSGGEKARLCLAGLFLSNVDVLLLDEPTNHLDFETVEAMGQALGDFNGTVMVVSHDRTFVNLLANEIWEVRDGSVKVIQGSYEDYVWNKEQEVANEQSTPASSGYSVNPSDSKPAKTLDKEQRVKLYNLKKDLDKVNRKMATLSAKVETNPSGSVSASQLLETEAKWLEISKAVEELEG